VRILKISVKIFLTPIKLNNWIQNYKFSMNSLTVVTIASILIAMGPLAITFYQTANAQYTTGQDTGVLSVEEQLRLAKEKVANAQQAGAYGSGTAFFGKNIGDAAIYTGAIVAIFGAVAAAFIVMSRGKKSVSA
jgi:dolichyl-phosphate-mannose--protein O-mannosyl transferase